MSEEKLQQAIDRLENHIEQECALVRKELRQELRQDFRREIARLDHKLDALDKFMTAQFSSVLVSFHGLHTDIGGLVTRMDGLVTRMDGLVTRMDDFCRQFTKLVEQSQTILDLLQRCQRDATSQPVPNVVARPSSSDSYGTVSHDALLFTAVGHTLTYQ